MNNCLEKFFTVSCFGSPQPLRQMADKVKEEVALGDADDLVADHNEQGEPLGTGKAESLGDGAAEIL